MRKILLCFLTFSVVLGTTNLAFGYKPFYEEWIELYVDDTDTSKEAKDYADVVTDNKTKCLVCHQGKKKKNRNEYGKLFEGVIGKKDQKDKQKIIDALKDIGKKKSDESDSSSKTYAELIKEFKLPGGDVEDLKKEPDAKDE